MEAKEKNYIQNKGITLVALVITIVILLILAGISISILTNTGIFQKAKDAKQKSENAQKEEESFLSEYEKEILKQDSNGIWDGNVNKPELMTGMKAIQFNEPTDTTEGSVKKVDNSNATDWYDYKTKKWANAQTEDGSMWVWIPRYAYKVVYNDPSDKSKGGKFDIVFLIGTTDNYIDDNGNIKTAQRQTEKNQVIETDSTKTDKYTVHPAFTNESSIDYANGGWNKELTGIWVAKFEAGYFNKEKEKDKIKSSSINYSQAYVWNPYNKKDPAKNYLDGIYANEKNGSFTWIEEKTTSMKYPTFQGEKYSMNYINHNDAFCISKALTEKGNVYTLDNKSTDSHLIKNSEWGSIAYLSQSKYGLNGTNIRINNVNENDDEHFVYAMTGYAAKTDDLSANAPKDSYKWTELEGMAASTTGTIYGIYDLSGGTWERVATVVNNGNSSLNDFGKAILAALNNGKSSEYVTVYPTGEEKGNSLDAASKKNYYSNIQIYGDAIRETSTEAIGQTSWFWDHSYYSGGIGPLTLRGGGYSSTQSAGIFGFSRTDGDSNYNRGFRAVLVKK